MSLHAKKWSPKFQSFKLILIHAVRHSKLRTELRSALRHFPSETRGRGGELLLKKNKILFMDVFCIRNFLSQFIRWKQSKIKQKSWMNNFFSFYKKKRVRVPCRPRVTGGKHHYALGSCMLNFFECLNSFSYFFFSQHKSKKIHVSLKIIFFTF